jgi:hypothetical protein
MSTSIQPASTQKQPLLLHRRTKWRSVDGWRRQASVRCTVQLSPIGHQPGTTPVTPAFAAPDGAVRGFTQIRLVCDGCAFRAAPGGGA